jgi:predicted nucleic acid-binding protein
VIYVDTSVILAQLLAEDRSPSPGFFESETLVASRLVQYEAWNRINALGLNGSHGEDLRQLLGAIAFLELTPAVLARATEPIPSPVRTLDALHLASIDFLRSVRQRVTLATYDNRMAGAASAIGIATVEP